MRANELMIGDWVQGFLPDTYSQVYGVINDCRVAIVGRGAYMEVSNEDILPIPLTAEILEKNGFERRKLDGGAEEFVLTDDYYDITIEEWSDSIWVVRYDCTEMSTPHEQAVCGYVHQLQNFFRLSAPDELADNFKV